MAEGVNVRFPEKLRDFVEERSSGLYGSASEYIRDLVRRDFEAEESRKSAWLKSELAPGIAADDKEFHTVTADEVIKRNRG